MRIILLILALGLGGLGCYARGTATYGSPGPRVMVVDEYPGWLWVDGQWYWNGSRYVWVDGYWIQDRPDYVYVPGYYHPHSHIWIAGTWSSRGYYGDGGGHSYYYSAPRDHRGTTYHSAPPASSSRSRVRAGRHR
jgi:hypothetical protein